MLFFSRFVSRPLKHFLTVSNRNCTNFIKNDLVQKYFDRVQKDPGLLPKDKNYIVDQLLESRKELFGNIESLKDLENSAGKNMDDIRQMLIEEKEEIDNKLEEVEFKLLDALAPSFPNSNEIIIEVNAGVGGQEAMLFANELREMYLGYADFKRWEVAYQDAEMSDLGGLRRATLFINGRSVLSHLRQESGVHRVQRIPSTEKSGRIHTSTVTVAVFPRGTDVDVRLNDKDISVDTMRSSGAGGQHVNKTESAVRMTHLPTGVVVECQTERSQIKNREIAKQKLLAKLYSIQQKERITTFLESRKSQIGTSARSDKIRTYNFPQDRITDHRISKTYHNLPVFLEGREQLDSLIQELIIFSDKERFESFILSLKDELASVQ